MNAPFDHLYAHAGRRRRRRPGPWQQWLGQWLGIAALALIAASLLAGHAHGKVKPAPGFEPALATGPRQRPADGSIFDASTGYAGLVEGARGHAVGDMVTVVLQEQFTTSKTAAAKTGRTGAYQWTPPTSGPLTLLKGNALNSTSNSTFDGSGNASQTSSLGGTIAVTITEVRPNGTAFVKGEKRLTLSQGQEWVQFSGIVHLTDIDTTGQVLSGQVADARITYSGTGAIARASRQGWLSRFFNAISPF